jgi:hypothetical protein
MTKKNRKIEKNNFKNEIKCLLKNIKFKSINLTLSKQIIIIWLLLWFVSLYYPWIIDIEKWISWNSFYSLTWNIWYLLIIMLLLPIFVIFSTNYKEKIKLYSDLSVKNHYIVISSGFIIISFSIMTLSFINWLHTFFEYVVYWKWVVLAMTSGFIILFWWFLLRKEYYSDTSEIILNKLINNREKNKEDDNMKLPF